MKKNIVTLLAIFCGLASVSQKIHTGAYDPTWARLIKAIEAGDINEVAPIVPNRIHPNQRATFGRNLTPLKIAKHHSKRGPGYYAVYQHILSKTISPATRAAMAPRPLAPSAMLPRRQAIPPRPPAPMFAARPTVPPRPPAPTQRFNPVGQPIQEFTIMTSNVLEQGPYIRNFKGDINRAMRQDMRQRAFTQAVTQEYQPDVIALQEYGFDSPRLPLDVNNFYHYVTDAGYMQPGNDLFLGAVKSKFHDNPYWYHAKFNVPGAQDKGFVALIVTPKNNTSNPIGIINAHLKGGTGPHGYGYDNFRQAQLDQIINYINSRPDVAKWIITGDFNWTWNYGGPADQWIRRNGFNLNDSRTTLFENGNFVKKDYILSRNLNQIPAQNQHMLITPGQQLLTHSPADSYKRHYSDHAALQTKFAVPAAQPAPTYHSTPHYRR